MSEVPKVTPRAVIIFFDFFILKSCALEPLHIEDLSAKVVECSPEMPISTLLGRATGRITPLPNTTQIQPDSELAQSASLPGSPVPLSTFCAAPFSRLRAA